MVFGGVVTTLLDHAGGLAVICSLAELKAIATLDLRIDYLRAAEPSCDLVDETQCYRLATHVGFVRATAWERARRSLRRLRRHVHDRRHPERQPHHPGA